jgi:hypothetical protein
MASVSMLAREEPLIRQLVRSRALQPRDQSLSPRSNSGQQLTRSASLGAPRQRIPAAALVTTMMPHPAPVYQFFPHAGVAISQPDLTKMYSYAPASPTISRCQSPTLPPSSSNRGSPVPANISPMSRPSTPTTFGFQSRPSTPTFINSGPPDLINSIYTAPKDIYHHYNNNNKNNWEGEGYPLQVIPYNSEVTSFPQQQQQLLPPPQVQPIFFPPVSGCCQMCSLFYNSGSACPGCPQPSATPSAREVTMVPCPICPAVEDQMQFQEKGSDGTIEVCHQEGKKFVKYEGGAGNNNNKG